MPHITDIFKKKKTPENPEHTKESGTAKKTYYIPFYKILLWCFLTAIVSGAILYFFVFLNSYFSFSLKETSILDEAVNSIQEAEESRNTILNVQVDFYERNLMFAAYQTELLEKDHPEMEPQAICEEMVRHFSPYEIAVTDLSGNILAHTPEFDMDQYKGISEVPDEGVTIVEEDRSFEFVPCRVTAVRRLNASALVLLQYDENLDGGLVALKNSFSLSQLVAAKSSDEEFVYVVNSDDVIIACGMPDLIGKRQSEIMTIHGSTANFHSDSEDLFEWNVIDYKGNSYITFTDDRLINGFRVVAAGSITNMMKRILKYSAILAGILFFLF